MFAYVVRNDATSKSRKINLNVMTVIINVMIVTT